MWRGINITIELIWPLLVLLIFRILLLKLWTLLAIEISGPP